jgi:hypothetical protein
VAGTLGVETDSPRGLLTVERRRMTRGHTYFDGCDTWHVIFGFAPAQSSGPATILPAMDPTFAQFVSDPEIVGVAKLRRRR